MLDMEQKIKIFKALGNETRFLIFKNVFTSGYACSIDDSKPKDDIIAQATCVTTIAKYFDFALLVDNYKDTAFQFDNTK